MPTVDDLIDLIERRDERAALALLDAHPDLATGESRRDGKLAGATPLHWAAHRNQLALCRALLRLGVEVNADTARWWRSPLAWAADAGHVAAVELLLAHGADVNQDCYGNTTALHAAAQGGSTNGRRDPDGYVKTAETLIAAGIDLDRSGSWDGGLTPLGDALRLGNQWVAAVLRRHGAREQDAP